MIVSKQVAVHGTTFELFGYASDPYFRDVEAYLQHGFLASLLRDRIETGASIIDVGANIGGTTALMHRLVDRPSVVGIEPSRMFDCLQKTIAANGFADTRAINLCAGREDGTVRFVDCGDYDGASGSTASHSHIACDGAEGSTIPVRTLDTIVRELGLRAVDLVKIDIEGFEEDVLDGMTFVNATYRPLIFMEFNPFALSIFAKRSPYPLLERIRRQFGGFVTMRAGRFAHYESDRDLYDFFYENMTTHGCVEDIVFSASPGWRGMFGV